MKPNKIRKIIHFFSTIWLTTAIFYFLINALRVWGVRWWVIFSLSGYSLLLIIFLISAYLFAIYNGLVRNTQVEKEHPLTRTFSYMMLYDTSPLLGAIAASCAITSADNFQQIASILSTGTFAVTFLFWIIIDPVLNLFELTIPACRQTRKQRIQNEKLVKIEEKIEHEKLIEQLKVQERDMKNRWKILLQPLSRELQQILISRLDESNRKKIIDIGLKAWQIGGINCMAELAGMTLGTDSQFDENIKNRLMMLWHGIGEWRNNIKTTV